MKLSKLDLFIEIEIGDLKVCLLIFFELGFEQIRCKNIWKIVYNLNKIRIEIDI